MKSLKTMAAGILASAALFFVTPGVAWGAPPLVVVPHLSGLEEPVHITHAGDGSGRLFIVERSGRIQIAVGGSFRAQPFLDISGQVESSGFEEGLLSVAFPPGFSSSGNFYVYYTSLDGNNTVARFSVGADPNLADPGSEEVLLLIPHPGRRNHNGGQIAFGPNDGFLYIGTGDGGGGGDPDNNAQDPSSLLGKLLRIDVEGGGIPYGIPAGNPFVGRPGFREEIWALGLRNPWRFSFDSLNGDLYIGDVGQQNWEEIDVQASASPGGENYGWPIREGNACYRPAAGCSSPPDYSSPVTVYSHGKGCSVTGGVVHRGAGGSHLDGLYLFGDFCSGRIWGLERQGANWSRSLLFGPSELSISSFGRDEDGKVYLADFRGGSIHLLVSTIFRDTFSGRPGPDPDWELLNGTWRVTSRRTFRSSRKGENLALVDSTRLAPMATGRIETRLRLGKSPSHFVLVFSFIDPGHFRYVRIGRRRIVIGQEGAFPGDPPGILASRSRRFRPGIWHRIRIDLGGDGSVKVVNRRNGSIMLSGVFSETVPGRTGVKTVRAAAEIDNFRIFDDTVFP